MALVDVTPVMTSNTTPSPYAVSASNIYSSTYDAWKAFNGTLTDINDCWVTANGYVTGWIKLDFGIETRIDAFSVYARYNSTGPYTEVAKDYILYGSNDNINFEQIISITGQVQWNSAEGRLHKLSESVSFRYYRLNIVSNNGSAGDSLIGEIKFWQKDTNPTTYITTTSSSLNYCLPKSSTLSIKQKKNDAREGYLGFANDKPNYGTLYMVNDNGQAIIPAASTKCEEIFSGSVGKSATGTLTNDYSKYKFLVIKIFTSSSWYKYITIPVANIVLNNTNIMDGCTWGSAQFYLRFGFTSTTTFYVPDIWNATWIAPTITNIYGIC